MLFKKKKQIQIILERTETPPEVVPVAPDSQERRGAQFVPDDYSPYQLREQKASEIEFFDFGRRKLTPEGDYQDYSFEKPMQWTTSTLPGSNVPVNFYIPMSVADWAEYKGFLLTLPENKTLEDIYEKFTYEGSDFLYVDVENYATGDSNIERIGVARDNSRPKLYTNEALHIINNTPNPDPVAGGFWTTSGLKLPTKKPHLRVKSYPYFEDFDTGNELNFKITDVPDFSGEAVAFNVAKTQTKVFLVPKLYLESAYQTVNYQPQNSDGRVLFTSAQFVQMPRTFKDFAQVMPFVGSGNRSFAFWPAAGNLGYFYTARSNPFVAPIDPSWVQTITDTIYSRRIKQLLAIEFTTAFTQQGNPYLAPLSNWQNLIQADVANYKRMYSLNQAGNLTFFYNDQTILTRPKVGSLVTVLQQKNDYFYVWAKRENPNYSNTAGETAPGGQSIHQWDLR